MPAGREFANVAYIGVTEAVASTLIYKKLETGVSLFEKIAWVINRLEYYLPVEAIIAASDSLQAAITVSDQLTTIDLERVEVVDGVEVVCAAIGTPASGHLRRKPYVKDFADLPGGGIIVPPNPLYLAAKCTDVAAVKSFAVRLFYTPTKLKGEEFWELVEARRMISST